MKFFNTYFNLPSKFYSQQKATSFSNPKLIKINKSLAAELNLDLDRFSEDELAKIFSGQIILEGSKPIALAYAGHQFGHFVPQLGDGRALLLGEVKNHQGKLFDIQLKGSGRTVFSRGGDGLSALGPVIREYILSEGMFHLGVPTTRALAAVTTGDNVYREIKLPGGVFTRVASGHIRIGTFQYFSSRDDIEGVKTLLDYAISRHYPEITEDKALNFLKAVINKQVSLVTNWMSLGFIHGVMNTDNMTVSGETIDYGPCAFMDHFDFHKVFSSIDRNGRYAYSNQGQILAWNMSRLAECLIPLVHSNEKKAIELLNSEISSIEDLFSKKLNERMTKKLGLKADSFDLVKIFLEYLNKEQLDFTLSFRNLTHLSWFKKTPDFLYFEKAWTERLKDHGLTSSKISRALNSVNPLYIPRNHQVERAIKEAQLGNYQVFDELNQVLENPFETHPLLDSYSRPPLPEEVITATFCGT